MFCLQYDVLPDHNNPSLPPPQTCRLPKAAHIEQECTIHPHPQVAVSRKPYIFNKTDSLFTLDDLEECRIFLFQEVTEQQMNALSPLDKADWRNPDDRTLATHSGLRPVTASLLHRLIKAQRTAACLALLEEESRFRQINHVTSRGETSLMAACREKMTSVCLALLNRHDFAALNAVEYHKKFPLHFVPRTDVSSLRELEGSVLPDGGYTVGDRGGHTECPEGEGAKSRVVAGGGVLEYSLPGQGGSLSREGGLHTPLRGSIFS